MIDRAISAAEFARRYAIGHHKVLTLIAKGELEAVNLAADPRGRPQWRISAEAISAFERRRAAPPKAKPTRRARSNKDVGIIEFF